MNIDEAQHNVNSGRRLSSSAQKNSRKKKKNKDRVENAKATREPAVSQPQASPTDRNYHHHQTINAFIRSGGKCGRRTTPYTVPELMAAGLSRKKAVEYALLSVPLPSEEPYNIATDIVSNEDLKEMNRAYDLGFRPRGRGLEHLWPTCRPPPTIPRRDPSPPPPPSTSHLHPIFNEDNYASMVEAMRACPGLGLNLAAFKALIPVAKSEPQQQRPATSDLCVKQHQYGTLEHIEYQVAPLIDTTLLECHVASRLNSDSWLDNTFVEEYLHPPTCAVYTECILEQPTTYYIEYVEIPTIRRRAKEHNTFASLVLLDLMFAICAVDMLVPLLHIGFARNRQWDVSNVPTQGGYFT